MKLSLNDLFSSKVINNLNYYAEQHLIFDSLEVTRSDTHDSQGRPIEWVPCTSYSPPGKPQLYAKYLIPRADEYVLDFGVLPLPTTVASTTSSTTTVSTSTTDAPAPPSNVAILLSEAPIPSHQTHFFVPKLIRDRGTVRLVHYRYDEQRKCFCWQVMAQPLREPTSKKPSFRISCPNLDRKFDFESVFWFIRDYNIRADGTYYKACAGPVKTNCRGYGKLGTFAPDTDCKF